MELGGGGQHLLLGDLPHLPGHRHQQLHQVGHVVGEPAVGVEVALQKKVKVVDFGCFFLLTWAIVPKM